MPQSSNEDILLSIGIDTVSLMTARDTIQRKLGGIMIPISISGVDQASLQRLTSQIGTASVSNERLARARLQTENQVLSNQRAEINNLTALERLEVSRLKTSSVRQKVEGNNFGFGSSEEELNKKTDALAKSMDYAERVRIQGAFAEAREQKAANERLGKQQEDAYREDRNRTKRNAEEILKEQQSSQLRSEKAKAGWLARLGKAQDHANIEERKRNQKLLEEQEKTANAPNKTLAEFGKALKWATIFTVVYTGIRALRASVGALIQEMIAVDEAAVLLKRNLDLTGESLNRGLNQAMVDAVLIGHRYGQSMTDVIMVQDRFAKQGLGMTDIAKATDAVLLGAATTLMTTADMAQAASVAMKTFGLSTDELSGMMDKLNETSRHFNVTAADLALGLQKMGGSAKQVGLDLDTSIGLITGIAEATGRSGVEIGNALRTMSAFIYRSNTIKGLENLGIAVRGLNGEFRPFNDILLSIAKRWTQFTDAEQENIVELTGGALRREQMLAIMQQYPTVITATVTSQNSYLSSMREMSIMMDTVSFKAGQVKNSFQSLATTISQVDFIKGSLDVFDAAIRHIDMYLKGLNIEQRKFIEGTINIQKGSMMALGRISEEITVPMQAFNVISEMMKSGMDLIENKRLILKSLEGITSVTQGRRSKILAMTEQKELAIILFEILTKISIQTKNVASETGGEIIAITDSVKDEIAALVKMIGEIEKNKRPTSLGEWLFFPPDIMKRLNEQFNAAKDSKEAIDFIKGIIRELDFLVTKINNGTMTLQGGLADMAKRLKNFAPKEDITAPFKLISDAIVQYNNSLRDFERLSIRPSGLGEAFSDQQVRNAGELVNFQETLISGLQKEIEILEKTKEVEHGLGIMDDEKLAFLGRLRAGAIMISNLLFGQKMQTDADKFFTDLSIEQEKFMTKLAQESKDLAEDISIAPSDADLRQWKKEIDFIDSMIDKQMDLQRILEKRKETPQFSEEDQATLNRLNSDINALQQRKKGLSKEVKLEQLLQYKHQIAINTLLSKSIPIQSILGSQLEKDVEKSDAALSSIKSQLQSIKDVESKIISERTKQDLELLAKKTEYEKEFKDKERESSELRLKVIDRENSQLRDKLDGYNQEMVLVREINRLIDEKKPDEAFSKQIELIQLKMEQISKFSGAISETIVSSLDTTKMRQPLVELGNSLKSIFADIVKEDITNQLSASMGKSFGILDGFEKGSIMAHDAIISAFMQSRGIITSGGISTAPNAGGVMMQGGFAVNAPTGATPSWWSKYGTGASMVGMSAIQGMQEQQAGVKNPYASLIGAGLGLALMSILGPAAPMIGGLLGSLFSKPKKQQPTPVKEPMLEIVHRDLEYVNRNLVALMKPLELFALPASYYFSQKPVGGVQVQGVTVNVYGVENASQMSDAITTAVAQGFTVSSKRVYQGV